MNRPNLQRRDPRAGPRVLFEGKRASASVQPGRRAAPGEARREVLLSGGAINSPQLLLLSGIGPGALLQPHGIEVVHDLPGVGENLQDHLGGRSSIAASTAPTMNEIYHSWLRGFMRGPQYRWPEGPLMTGAGPIGLFVEHPAGAGSRRTCSISSSPAARTRPAIRCTVSRLHPGRPFRAVRRAAAGCASPADPAAARDPAELPVDPTRQGHHRRRAEDRREIFATAAMRGYVTEEYMPGPQASRDEDLLDMSAQTAGTTFHPTSTCMMGPGADGGGGYRLRVTGIEGLRVIDAAIMPTVVSGNTNATVIMIAEKVLT